jgi:ABC-2 type transport system ATP-binding protein
VQGIRAMLRELGGSQTLIFSSHILAEVEALCDRIVILSRGRVVADESIRDALSSDTIVVEWPAEQERVGVEAVHSVLARFGISVDALAVSRAGERSRGRIAAAEVGAAALSDAIGRAFLTLGVPILRLEPGARRLEERFARATGFAEDHG